MRLVYGVDTGSIEEFSQCVIIDVPDHWDLDTILDEVASGKVPMTWLADLVDENIDMFFHFHKLQSQLED